MYLRGQEETKTILRNGCYNDRTSFVFGEATYTFHTMRKLSFIFSFSTITLSSLVMQQITPDAYAHAIVHHVAIQPYRMPAVSASGMNVLTSVPSLLSIEKNTSLHRAVLLPPDHSPVLLSGVVYDPKSPNVLVYGHVTKKTGKPVVTRAWVQIDDLGERTLDPVTWQYPVPVAKNGTFAAVLHIPFSADVYEVQAAPPLNTAQTSLNYTFATNVQTSTKPFAMKFSSQDSDQALGLLTSVWADASDPAIVALAHKITQGDTTPLQKAQAVYTWEGLHIGYNGALLRNNGYGWSTTEETLATKRGICVDYANVGDAFLRALGISTQMVVGYAQDSSSSVADNGNTGHAWNRAWIGNTWVYFDPTWSREYLTSVTPSTEPEPTDLYLLQPQWFNPSAKLLDTTHSMSGIQYQ